MPGPDLIPHDEALLQILSSLDKDEFKSSTLSVESCDLLHATNRILAQDYLSPIDVPGDDNSAMDGVALNSRDFSGGETLEYSQYLTAGKNPLPLLPKQVVRIFTGAILPDNADTVIAQEDCYFEGAQGQVVTLPKTIHVGANVRKRGQDIRRGTEVFKKGRVLSPQDIGLLASMGVPEVECYRPIKVGLLCTGDELQEPGEEPQKGKIYNSNQYMLFSLLENMGVELTQHRIVSDSLTETEKAFRLLATQSDAVISTGGVSVGESDFVKQAVESLGGLEIWRLALKPGKPFSFGHVVSTPFFGLPGNPVAAFLTFLLLVKPALRKLQGASSLSSSCFYRLKAGFSTKANSKRVEFLRVNLVQDEQSGEQIMHLYSNQSSGVLSSVCFTEGLAKVEIGHSVSEGDLLEFIPYQQLL